jgi:DNA mismatch repair protein MutL
MPIHQLDPDVAAKIAAGEVVERPASVVKELIENSIDAGATQLRVDLSNGGLRLIRVTDNGSGIPAGELLLALARHATSKVARIDDLEHIRSLGFRGEALASIAAVAEVVLLSHHRGDSQGAQVSASNGRISDVSAAGCPEGTIVTVRNLFSAVPARLKFLKSRNTEVSHCHHLLEQYALAYPEIRFSVFSEGRQIFATAGDGQLSSVLLEVYGLQIAEQMVPISSLDGKDSDPERPVASGYISLPTCYKSTRQYLSFFVNRRWVLSRMLTYAVEEAYHSLLLSGRHPIVVVNIQLDPALLDVNVHPAKTEIRFLKERRIYSAVQRAVRSALLQEAEMPQWQGKQGLPSSQHNSPSPAVPDTTKTRDTGEDEDAELTNLLNGETDNVVAPLAGTLSGGQVSREAGARSTDPEPIQLPQDNPWLTVTEEETGTKPPMLSRLWQSHIPRPEPTEIMNVAREADANALVDATLPNVAGSDQPIVPAPVINGQGETGLHPLGENGPTRAFLSGGQVSARVPTPLHSTPAPTDVPSQESKPGEAKPRRLPPLRVLGQLSQSYIVAEGQDGMYLIDQHAAHERILLERMVAALQARTPISQLLLTPMRLELAPTELAAIEDHMQQLEHIGFTLEMLDDNALLVQAVPNVLVKRMNAHSLHDLLAELTAPEHAGYAETWEEHALANVACKAAIKANYFLTVSEMREMIEQLEKTNAPYSCCHGRPTMIHFSLSALEREFGRR